MAAFTGSGAAICFSALMMSSQFAPAMGQRQHMAIQLAQQEEQVKTATASSSTKSDACSLSTDKAFNLCINQGLNSIKRVTCECTEIGPPAATRWECVGTAVCQK
jgi:hypothetical protein